VLNSNSCWFWSPSFPIAVKRFLPRLYTSLHVPLDFHQHPTACSYTILITTWLLQSHPLINSTPPTTTLGVVTWRLGIVLRRSGASFLAHLSPLQSLHHPGKGRRINSKHSRSRQTRLLALCGWWLSPLRGCTSGGLRTMLWRCGGCWKEFTCRNNQVLSSMLMMTCSPFENAMRRTYNH